LVQEIRISRVIARVIHCGPDVVWRTQHAYCSPSCDVAG
jgi:hypothetical protein